MQKQLSFFTLLLLISFASVNAVLFTPALPTIASFFTISIDHAQLTITYFLIGYAIGQLIYGPLANRYGRKPALYMGILLQIISSLICMSAGILHLFWILIIGRFMLALGSGVGLKMTYTLVNESYEPKQASQKIAYLTLAFAITPALAVALGGLLNTHFGWMSCFVASLVYGSILFLFVTQLPETQVHLNLDALKIKNLFHDYATQFKNIQLIGGGFLMGSSTSFVYVFAALTPFVAMDLLGMTSIEYGTANLLPAIGLITGSLSSAQLVKRFSLHMVIRIGILIVSLGVTLMLLAVLTKMTPLYSIFLPMILIYFGLSFVIANASTLAMSQVNDKAHGSAVMSFINMGMATIAVLSLGSLHIHINTMILPIVYILITLAMITVYQLAMAESA